MDKPSNTQSISRRHFVQSTAVGAGLTLARPELVFGSSANSAFQLGVIGCGGRGNNDAGVFIRYSNTQVTALADMFEDRLGRTKERLDSRLKELDRPPIDSSRLYEGMNSYQELLATDVDGVLITSPPYYHPLHLEAAIDAGKHAYCEKPVATDVMGAKRVIAAGKKAEGKVSVAVGFQIRHSKEFQEIAKRVHRGDIGKPVCGQVYYHTGRLGNRGRRGASEQENRLRNWVFDQELSGDIIVEQNIHVIDVANWYLQNHPIKAYGTGGRKARTDVGDCWDHFIVTFWYPDDVLIDFSSTQFLRGWGDCRERIFGTKGCADSPYNGFPQITGDNAWTADNDGPLDGTEASKMKALVDSVISGNYINETAIGAESTMTSILGRMASYENREVTWDEMIQSNQEYNPNITL